MILNYINFLKIKFSTSIDSKWICATNNVRILRYEIGNEIKDHLDVNLVTRGSCTINLNEGYEGGEFTFFSRKHQEILKTGDSIIFPAELKHEVPKIKPTKIPRMTVVVNITLSKEPT